MTRRRHVPRARENPLQQRVGMKSAFPQFRWRITRAGGVEWWHRYPDGSLCLYWPDEWGWTARESLAATIVPWTAFWLYYYELWLVTGEWLGPSSPHRLGTGKEAA